MWEVIPDLSYEEGRDVIRYDQYFIYKDRCSCYNCTNQKNTETIPQPPGYFINLLQLEREMKQKTSMALTWYPHLDHKNLLVQPVVNYTLM